MRDVVAILYSDQLSRTWECTFNSAHIQYHQDQWQVFSDSSGALFAIQAMYVCNVLASKQLTL